MQTGNRVTIAIRNPSEWAMGAAEVLNGKTGTIEEVQECERMTKYPLKKAKYLVRFDTPAGTWSTNQTPPASFWFDSDEVKQEQGR